MQFTQCPAVSEVRPGGRFSLYNDNIQGEYVTLEESKLLEMNWKFKDWDVYSHVLITLDIDDDEDVRIPTYLQKELIYAQLIKSSFFLQECVVQIKQTNIPSHDKYLKHVHLDNLENGWRSNIFERLSKVFGYALKK